MKFNKWSMALAATGVVSAASVAQAQESHPVNTLLSSTTLSGFVDTSAIWKLDHGRSVINRFANTGSDRQNGFNLNSVNVQLEKAVDEGTWSAGYKTELMFGPDASVMPGRLGNGSDLAIKQAYAALRAPVGNGIDFKVGQFDPIIGYETTSSYQNPNFSRSLAFSNLEPYGHQGILASYQFSDVLGVSAGIANSANNTSFAGPNGGSATLGNINAKYFGNSFKSYMGGLVLKAPDSLGWLAGSSLYAGVVHALQAGESNDPVTFYVGASIATPLKALTLGVGYDYRANGIVNQYTGYGTPAVASAAKRDGGYANALSTYISYQLTEKLKLNNRVEYATSSGGVFLPVYVNDERVFALTSTLDYALFANVVTRIEGRWDTTVGSGGAHKLRNFDGGKNTVSLLLNVIYKF
jgi:hypothetical protein